MAAKRNVLVDVDHTLSDARWRDPIIETGDWEEYHSLSPRDKPFSEIVALVNALAAAGYNIIALTARDEKWRRLTLDWLVKQSAAVHEVLMRPEGDFRRSPELKLALACARFGDAAAMAEEVAFIIDDREDVITQFLAAGVTGLMTYGRRQ